MTKKKGFVNCSIGLDLSLTGTGVVVLDKYGVLISHNTISSKPTGDNPLKELTRLETIVDTIRDIKQDYSIDVAVIEGVAMGIQSKNTSLVQLSALNYLVRIMCRDEGIPFIICPPTTNKKYITGKGNSPKDVVLMHVYKNWGFEADNNNESDAFGLAHIGASIIHQNDNLLKHQKEVVDLLKNQL